jgi:hypothetical protein
MSGSETTPGGAEHGLKKTLGTGFVLAVVVGGVIGLGILRTPGEIATVVPDPLQYLSLWVLGGAFVPAAPTHSSATPTDPTPGS